MIIQNTIYIIHNFDTSNSFLAVCKTAKEIIFGQYSTILSHGTLSSNNSRPNVMRRTIISQNG